MKIIKKNNGIDLDLIDKLKDKNVDFEIIIELDGAKLKINSKSKNDKKTKKDINTD